MKSLLNPSLIIVSALSALALSACQSTSLVPETTVSVQFDPDDYDELEMRQAAISMCRAKGYDTAEVYMAQPTMTRQGWNYRTYGCY